MEERNKIFQFFHAEIKKQWNYLPYPTMFITVPIQDHNADCSRGSCEDAMTLKGDTVFENQSSPFVEEWLDTIEPVLDELVRERILPASWTSRGPVVGEQKGEKEIGDIPNWTLRKMTNRSSRCWSSCSSSIIEFFRERIL